MSNRDAPSRWGGRIAGRSSFGLADFVADDATHGCTANGSDSAAAGKNGTSDGTNSSADDSVLILRRHSGTTTQAQQHCCSNCNKRKSLRRFHGTTSFSTLFAGVSCMIERACRLPGRLRSIQKMLLGAARVHVALDSVRPGCVVVNKYLMSIPDPEVASFPAFCCIDACDCLQELRDTDSH